MNKEYFYGDQIDEDIINNVDDNVDYNVDYNNDQNNPYELENNNESEYNLDNQYFLENEENIELKKKIVELNQLLALKNEELKENRIKNDNQLMKINKTFDTHINEYQRLFQNYSYLQKELNKAQKEIENKNQIINQIQNNRTINNNEDRNLVLLLNKKIKNIYQNFFEKGNNIFNDEIFSNLDKNNQIKILLRNIDIFSQELLNYKKNYFNNKNIIENSNNIGNIEIDPQFYFKFIDLINNFLHNFQNNNFNNLPIYSIKDKSDKKYNDVLITIKILTDYIFSNQNKNNLAPYNSGNNKYNEELNNRLNEMSKLLMKSNEYLNK
jgi:hypothetical protein